MYHEIIKKIRLEKGMTQKEVYANVVSKSFYSDFEAGKNSIATNKFMGLLSNLGISFTEFEYFQKENDLNLAEKIDKLYNQGKFEELYSFYLENHKNKPAEIRYLAIKAYLLVLITNTNFYKFSRDPFREIISDVENYKTWTLREISLAKLILLSFSESEKEKAEKIFQRIVLELEKYQALDQTVYFKEMCDLLFNRVQSLLVINDLQAAVETGKQYQTISQESDNLYLMIQYKFIHLLLNLYLAFPTYQTEMTSFLDNLKLERSSEFNFYKIIFNIHEEKAKNYFSRYQNKKSI